MKNLKIRLALIATGLILLAMVLGWQVPRIAQEAPGQMMRMEYVAVAAFVFLGLCGLLMHGLLERALRPIMNLSDHFVRMRAGDLNPRLPVEGPEEMQQLARTFNEMMEELELQIRDVTEEKYAAERGRQFLQEQLEASQKFQAMVDSAPLGIVLADPGLNIVYQNSASETGFLQLSDVAPWDTGALVGQPVTVLYTDGEEARDILSDPDRLPNETRVACGPYELQFLAVPVYSEEGDYLGPMLLWEVAGEVEAVDEVDEGFDLEEMDAVEELETMDEVPELELMDEPPEDTEAPVADTVPKGLSPFKRGATLIGRSVRLISDRISTISSMVEALCNEGDNLRRGVEEARQRTQNAASLTTERSEALWDLVNEMNGLGERTRASAALIKRLRKGLNDAEAIPSSISRLVDSIDHLVVEARLELGRAGDAGAGMKAVVDEVQKLGREASRLNKDVDTKLDRIRTEVEDMVNLLEDDRREVRAGGRLARRAENALVRIERDLTDVDERTDLLAEMAVGQSEIGTHVASQLAKLTELVEVTVRVAREQARLVEQAVREADELNKR